MGAKLTHLMNSKRKALCGSRGTKITSDVVWNECIKCERIHALSMADAAIEHGDDVALDVAANEGQIFHNVKHMTWFREAVADEFME